MEFSTLAQISQLLKKWSYSPWSWLVFFLFSFLLINLIALYRYRKRLSLPENQKVSPLLLYFKELFFSIWKACLKLPYVMLVFFILFFSERVLSLTLDLHEISENQKKIQELSVVVKNLSRIETVARIHVQSVDETIPNMKIRLSLLKDSGKEFQKQIFELEGRELWIDSLSINFDYLYIEKGKAKNIAIPFSLYTEKIAPKEAQRVQGLFDEKGVPALFRFEDEEVFGIEADRYQEWLNLLFSSPKKMKENGVRSVQGNALHLIPCAGAVYELRCLATGGLSLSRERF